MRSSIRLAFIFPCLLGQLGCSSDPDAPVGDEGPHAGGAATARAGGAGGTSSGKTSSGGTSSGGSGGTPDGGPAFPESVCGPEAQMITSVSSSWGPAWAPPDPKEIIDGWPSGRRYELWWIPMPAAPTGILAYRIQVPADFDANVEPAPDGQLGYVRTAESPSTGVATYEVALSETACDFANAVPIQADSPPYGSSGTLAHSAWDNAPTVAFQVRPKSMAHCVPLPGGGYSSPCLEPGHTYWWNLRIVPGGCDGNVPGDTSKCQPMIHVQRPRQVVDPSY